MFCDMGCSDKGVLCLSLQDTKPIEVIPLFGSSAKEGKSGREGDRGRERGGGRGGGEGRKEEQ